MADIPFILLAAGGSSRMGQPKQLLPWGKKTLIEQRIHSLLKTGNPVNVVLGANSNLVIPVIEKYNINIVVNNQWRLGMGSSISTGINNLMKDFPASEGVVITLVDQPLVTHEYFQRMLKKFQPGQQQIIISKSSSGWKGVPVLFDSCYFKDLQNLQGDDGAKKVIQKHKNTVKYIECGNLLEDMDTPDAYQKMIKSLE